MDADAAADSCRIEGLRAHNELRSVHGAPPLVWSDECSRLAQAWVDRCSEAGHLLPLGRGSWQQSRQSSYDSGGWQNLPWSETSVVANAVQSWYSSTASAWNYDVKGTDYSKFERDLELSHPDYKDFLRLLWVSTEYVGMAESSDGRFVIAVYDPPLPHPALERAVKANVLRPGALMARRAPKLRPGPPLPEEEEEEGACEAGCQRLWLRARLRMGAPVKVAAGRPTPEIRRLFEGVPGRFIHGAVEFVNEIFSEHAQATVQRRWGHLTITTHAHGSRRAYSWAE